MKTKCLNCDNTFDQTEGKRQRLYCSDKCRATYQQKKKVKVKWVMTENPEEIPEWVKDYFNDHPEALVKTKSVGASKSTTEYYDVAPKSYVELIERKIEEGNKSGIAAQNKIDATAVEDILKIADKYVPKKNTVWHVSTQEANEIQKQIDEIKKEKIPEARNTVYGRKVWQKEQDAKIDELKKQLK